MSGVRADVYNSASRLGERRRASKLPGFLQTRGLLYRYRISSGNITGGVYHVQVDGRTAGKITLIVVAHPRAGIANGGVVIAGRNIPAVPIRR